MTLALASPAPRNLASSSLILAAARAWREARDAGKRVQPVLYEALHAHRGGVLAPAFASPMTLYESWSGKPIQVGSHVTIVSVDEEHLLSLCDPSRGLPKNLVEVGDNDLDLVMWVAVHSARIMIGLALESVA